MKIIFNCFVANMTQSVKHSKSQSASLFYFDFFQSSNSTIYERFITPKSKTSGKVVYRTKVNWPPFGTGIV
jgi:hypothetical protein